jgi:hypothetical protein
MCWCSPEAHAPRRGSARSFLKASSWHPTSLATAPNSCGDATLMVFSRCLGWCCGGRVACGVIVAKVSRATFRGCFAERTPQACVYFGVCVCVCVRVCR